MYHRPQPNGVIQATRCNRQSIRAEIHPYDFVLVSAKYRCWPGIVQIPQPDGTVFAARREQLAVGTESQRPYGGGVTAQRTCGGVRISKRPQRHIAVELAYRNVALRTERYGYTTGGTYGGVG